ncbi:coat protein [ssRNA phage SRR6960803_12]|uniref:Coat protein n=1 Tax=ssRNA phage SRR6960803_12 TaxID=2786615 RepID=A0A8S5KZK3_9VIRU|nr:coat protein [ssRNA phage SRR6960803_12]DAD50736.1 TPA_asm: coat protein [ssRNA phage SRR6960803_12]
MPTMASLTVKKSDGTTDIVYDALSASGGDGSPAVWRQDTGAAAGLPVGLRKMFRSWTTWNGPKTARVVKVDYVYPYAVQDTTTTLYSAKDRAVFQGTSTIPQAMPASEIKEFAYQMGNLMAATLIKQVSESGFAPT